MPIPWLSALKVIPWGDVIEHAPKVLKGARELLEKQRQRRGDVQPVPDPGTGAIEVPDPVPPEVRELQQQLGEAKGDIARQQQTQDQIAQTLAELAEQNTRLVAAVELLRKRTGLLIAAVVLLTLALAAAVWKLSAA